MVFYPSNNLKAKNAQHCLNLRAKPVEENSLLLLLVPLPEPVPSAACDRDILCPLFLFGH